MTTETTPTSPPPPRKPIVRFSLLALLLFVTAACILLAWAVQPRKFVVEALFQISAAPPDVFGLNNSSFNEREFELLRHTQVEVMKSVYVLQAALRNPQIAALRVLKSQRDPITWLHEHLEVEWPKDSELLAIRLHCTEGEVPDSVLILNSVTSAYQNVVVFDKDQSHLVARDALVRSSSKLSQELESKLEELEAIKKSGKDGAEVQSRQLDIDVLTTTYRKCATALREMDMEAEAPKRIRLIQPATARQE
jgi:hypothetical protein